MRRCCALVAVLVLAAGAPSSRVDAAGAVTRWRDEAARAGWPASSWPWLECIIHRESAGNPHAVNRRDPHGGSFGLTQINRVWARPLMRAGIIRWPHDLYNPVRNLRAARFVYRIQGFDAWGGVC